VPVSRGTKIFQDILLSRLSAHFLFLFWTTISNMFVSTKPAEERGVVNFQTFPNGIIIRNWKISGKIFLSLEVLKKCWKYFWEKFGNLLEDSNQACVQCSVTRNQLNDLSLLHEYYIIINLFNNQSLSIRPCEHWL